MIIAPTAISFMATSLKSSLGTRPRTKRTDSSVRLMIPSPAQIRRMTFTADSPPHRVWICYWQDHKGRRRRGLVPASHMLAGVAPLLMETKRRSVFREQFVWPPGVRYHCDAHLARTLSGPLGPSHTHIYVGSPASGISKRATPRQTSDSSLTPQVEAGRCEVNEDDRGDRCRSRVSRLLEGSWASRD